MLRFSSAYDMPLASGLLSDDRLGYMSSPLSPSGSPGSIGMGVDSHYTGVSSVQQQAAEGSDGASPSAGGDLIKATPSKHPRLVSLDCFRGLVIAWMIVADEIGPAWGYSWDHAPWDGLHFADFVFPAFVFIVGLAVPLSLPARKLRTVAAKLSASRKALWRSVKMFVVGFLAATGGFPAKYSLDTIRIPGILQRIAFCYLVLTMIHVWVPRRRSKPVVEGEEDEEEEEQQDGSRSMLALFRRYAWHWVCAEMVLLLWLALTFGTRVPGCPRGSLDPECSATRYWDQKLIGSSHMYAHPTLQRSKWCSLNTPDDDPNPFAPAWCWEPFDPEGVVGTFTACLSGFFGLWFGYVLSNESSPRRRLAHWFSLSAVSLAAGLALHFSGALPINKNLWSLSYVLVMAGVDGAVFSLFYILVDLKQKKRFLLPLICMGMNAILVFVIAQSEISVDTALQWFYLRADDPTSNLYHWYRYDFLNRHCGLSWGTFTWAMTKVVCWLGISVVLAKKKIFWKL